LLRLVGLFRRQREVGFQIAEPALELAVGLDAVIGLLAFLQDSLRCLGIVPEAGFGEFLFEDGQAVAVLRDVKDSSAPAPRACEARRSGAADLPASSS
jgi:hypothetical protein